MWVAASENVRVINNVLYGSVIGFEITVSNNVWVTQNKIYDNTLGIGLFHPNGAGNPPLPVMANWVIEHNDVRNNNRPNDGRARNLPERLAAGHRHPGRGRFRSRGREEHRRGQRLRRASASSAGARPTPARPTTAALNPPIADPAANNNRVVLNTLARNGASAPPIPIAFLAADITYFEFEGSSGNCFEKNKPAGFSFVSSEPDGLLPTDGC